MREKWRKIPGFENSYEVSDLGRVRSLPRRVRLVVRGAETTRSVPEKILTPGETRSGHKYVFLGRKNRFLVHRLVLLAFVGPCPVGCEALHLDHTPGNNTLTNLRWGTRSENLKMDYAVGKRKTHPNFNRWGYRYASL